MNELTEFIQSGILELYVMGAADAVQTAEVERMCSLYEEIGMEITSIELSLEQYSLSHAVTPDPVIKPFLMAQIDYMERLGNGEAPSFPPRIRENSSISDYSPWLERPDLALRAPLLEIDARIIGYTPEMTTAIVWIRNGAPPEVHSNEYETFLIVEGTCNILVEGQDNHLEPGDVFTIPLHLSHTVMITSATPCKIILQRVAA